MIKSELRTTYLQRRKLLSAAERDVASRAIADHFFKTFDLTSVDVIHCFIPIERLNEIDTNLIFERLWREYPTMQTVVPRVDRSTGELQSLKFGPDTVLASSSWGIREPAHDEFVEASSIDVVLVPGVCFDRKGHRVGYGKGFYDRFLNNCRPDCLKVGLSYFEPVDAIADVHAGDVPLDALIIPAGVRKAERGMRNSS